MSTDGSITWRQLWDETSALVGDRHEARWLCEVASASVDGDEFLARLDEAATVRMVSHLDEMIARCARGEPLQYVLGEWSFRHVTLAVDQRVLIPRPETELVAEAALVKAAATGPTRVVADLGTGSGAIGLALAHELPRDGTTVWITDMSADALDVARANLAGIGPAAVNVRVAHGSWFAALPPEVRLDVVVANPRTSLRGHRISRMTCGHGNLTARCSPDPMGSTRSARSWSARRIAWCGEGGWSSRSERTRAPRWPSCCRRPGSPTSRSDGISPAATASPSVDRPDDTPRSSGERRHPGQTKRTAISPRIDPSAGVTS
jgi:protein-L-isoaspartate O-methyltransferase